MASRFLIAPLGPPVDQIMADNSQVYLLVEAGPIVMGTPSADQRVRAELFGGSQRACHACAQKWGEVVPSFVEFH